MTKHEMNRRLDSVNFDLASFAADNEIQKMSDEELLAFLEAPDEGDLNFRQMTDAELEALISGSPKTCRTIMRKYSKRRI